MRKDLIKVETYRKPIHKIVMNMVRNLGTETYIPKVYVTKNIRNLDSYLEEFKIIPQDSYYVIVGYPKDTWRDECKYINTMSSLSPLF